MQIDDYRKIWKQKPSLQVLYRHFSEKIFEQCVSGLSLEIGGGSGNLMKKDRKVITTDIQTAGWLDLVADAQFLPFQERCFSNIVMLDVLHHIENSVLFFREASRLLKPGGRVVMLEPAITPVSNFFYTHFHSEPVDMTHDVFADVAISPERNPYSSNQAVPTLLFLNNREKFEAVCSDFRIVSRSYLSLFAYPLSGGFKRWTLIPTALVTKVLELENFFLPLLGPLMAFRLLVVLERK